MILESKDLKVSKVSKASKARQVLKVLLVLLANKDHRVFKVKLGLKVFKERQVLKVLKGSKETLVILVRTLLFLVCLQLLVTYKRLILQVMLAMLGLLEQLKIMIFTFGILLI